MVKFTVEQVRKIMSQQSNIRNMTVIAHVDHGKSTLSDALICKAGIISAKEAGNARVLDSREDEINRGITIKSSGVSLYYRYDITGQAKPENEQEYLINLIDSPGHVDFSSEVTAALRVTDGALVVVDTVEGVCVQTETVLRQAIQERIQSLLMINKVDRAIGELKLSGEEIYQQFVRVIMATNIVIGNYKHEQIGQMCLPEIGNVIFGAGKDQWSFTLRTFARHYEKELALDQDTLMRMFWGDHYYNHETKEWQEEPTTTQGKQLKRGFVEFIIDPICNIFRAIMDNNKLVVEEFIVKKALPLTQDERKRTGKELLKLVFSKWLPAADCLLETMILHLPSPREAQQYRTEYLYEGPQDDVTALAMKSCDPHGPLCIFISKMIPVDGGRFAAFGRIFSGTVHSGEKIRIMSLGYKHGENIGLHEKSIGQVGVYMMGKVPEFIPDVPCGNTVALLGIDEYLMKTGTLASCDHPETYPIREMKYSVSPVFRVAVRSKNPADLPKLQKGLTKLAKSDPLLKCELEETGEIILAGSGELHMEICINDLRAFAQCEILVSDPTVTYKETITIAKQEPLLSKSANGHNRLFGTSDVLQSELIEAIELGQINESTDQKVRSKTLVEQFEWDKNDASKIWCFGPENLGANILVDCVKGAQYMSEIKDSVCSAFQDASKRGILADETLRGARFNLVDGKLHQDSVHRNGAQIVPCSRKLFQALELASMPTLLEPIFVCEISAPFAVLGGVYNTLSQRRASILEELKVEDSPLHIVKAYLPVAQSFGFTSVLRQNTQGMAFPQCFFDHWDRISGLPLEDQKAAELVKSIRKRKGLKEDIPILADYVDKL